ncbi:MAG: hypothetical protein ACAH07_02200 [Methylophilaceae bacterium]|nr:hypothetical protein [Methyloradius sp.]
MPHNEHSPSASLKSTALLLSSGVLLSLFIFVGTYFSYFWRYQSHISGSYLPLALGASAFGGLMLWLNYLVLPSQPTAARLAKAVGLALLGAVIFIFLFLFLLLNTIGS